MISIDDSINFRRLVVIQMFWRVTLRYP